MRGRAPRNLLPIPRGIHRRGRIAPIGGTTLLILVTLVLASGHRDSLPVRQSSAEHRWSEPAGNREVYDAESAPSTPDKPASHRFVGIGGVPGSYDPLPPLVCAEVPAAAPMLAPRPGLVRDALLNLPPPRG